MRQKSSELKIEIALEIEKVERLLEECRQQYEKQT